MLAISNKRQQSAPILCSGSWRQSSKRRRIDTTLERASTLGKVSANTENSEILLSLQAAKTREKQLEERLAAQQESISSTVVDTVKAQTDEMFAKFDLNANLESIMANMFAKFISPAVVQTSILLRELEAPMTHV